MWHWKDRGDQRSPRLVDSLEYHIKPGQGRGPVLSSVKHMQKDIKEMQAVLGNVFLSHIFEVSEAHAARRCGNVFPCCATLRRCCCCLSHIFLFIYM